MLNPLQFLFVAIAFVVLLASLQIARSAQPSDTLEKIFISPPDQPRVRNFLFGEHGFLVIAVSNLGSSLTFYVLMAAGTLFTFAWGSLVFWSGFASVIAANFAIWYLVDRAFRTWHPGRDQTFLDLFPDPCHKFAVPLIIIMALFTIFTILSELTTIRDLFATTGQSYTIMAATPLENLRSTFSITNLALIFCLIYVIRGGYKGVLWTDLFQVSLIFLFWFLWMYWITEYDRSFLTIIAANLMVNGNSLILGLGVFIAVFMWYCSSLDIWVRTADLPCFFGPVLA